MENNGVLKMVVLVENAITATKSTTRDLITTTDLGLIKSSVSLAMGILVESGEHDDYLTASFINILEFVDYKLSETDFVATDTETKDYVFKSLTQILERTNLFVGKYYMSHDFKYSLGLQKLLNRIVDSCISQRFYFGVDTSEVLGGAE